MVRRLSLADGKPEIGIAVEGAPDTVEAIAGAVVQTGFAPSTDVVTRAIDDGVEMIAILGDESAPNEISFLLEFPPGAELVGQADGVVVVVADMVREVPVTGEDERVTSETDQILGDVADADSADAITDEQWVAIEAIPEAETTTVAESMQVAIIEAPWAVDANGAELAAHYVVDGDTIKQVVETDEDTTYPPTADPSMAWVAAKIVGCTVSVASLTVVAAKIASISVKVINLLKKAKAGTALKKAYDAWLKLGSTNATCLKNLLNTLPVAVDIVRKHGLSKLKAKLLAYGGKVTVAATVIYNGMDVLTDVLGAKDCISLMTGKD